MVSTLPDTMYYLATFLENYPFLKTVDKCTPKVSLAIIVINPQFKLATATEVKESVLERRYLQ